MRITRLSTVPVQAERRTWCFVEVETDAGLVGVGEASQSRGDAGIAEQVRRLEARLLGTDPLSAVTPLQAATFADPFAGRLVYAAASAVEQALWDLAGKALGVPCHRLFGGAIRPSIPLYANVALAVADHEPDSVADAAARAVTDGFRAVKIYPAGVFAAGPETEAGAADVSGRRFWAAAEARLAAVRDAVGPDVAVLTDWAWQVSPADGPRLAALAEAYDLYWIEEPFAGTDPVRLRELSAHASVGRVAAGEQLYGRRAYRHLLVPRAVDVVMPDVKWIGGIQEARFVCAMAAAHDVEASPHNMSGPVATAASAHLAAVSPNVTLLEYCYGNTPWRGELVSGTEDVRDGLLHLNDRPGLGVAWDPAAARAHPPSI